jgi:hypothetical protein
VGIGIVPMTERRVQTEQTVRIRADHIGGPSAGLMFALEILNQLTPEDLTRGLKIAGTGTLSAEGEVGQIGGVEQKVMAADREGADLFICSRRRPSRGFQPIQGGGGRSEDRQPHENRPRSFPGGSGRLSETIEGRSREGVEH